MDFWFGGDVACIHAKRTREVFFRAWCEDVAEMDPEEEYVFPTVEEEKLSKAKNVNQEKAARNDNGAEKPM
ncbi:hypothetical protein E2542_SST26590 [Spatholobus suberectus]|nr:hypothetical protein E2542_SST26590 [Spatholobus suberectus]